MNTIILFFSLLLFFVCLQTTFSASQVDIMPDYQLYVNEELIKQVNPKANLSLWNIQRFNFSTNNYRVYLPFDERFKLGDGFDVKNYLSRGSPFFQPLLYRQSLNQQIEGNDGTINIHEIKDASSFAEALSIDAKAWGSGWGVDVKASFSYNSKYSIQSNEVILFATHVIDLGKSFQDPETFKLTEPAQVLLATNYQEFQQNYGSHYIAGYFQQCRMNIFFRSKVTASQSSTEVMASLHASFDFFFASGGIDVKVASESSQNSFLKNVLIEIQYFGANQDSFLSGVSVEALANAILEFPKHCNGNPYAFILVPYEHCQSFIDVKQDIDSILDYKALQEALAKQKSEEEYLKQLALQKKLLEQKILEEAEKEEKIQSVVQLIDDLFGKEILKLKVLIVSTQLNTKLTDLQKDDDQWHYKLVELKLSTYYKTYKAQAQQIANDSTIDAVDQIFWVNDIRQFIKKYVAISTGNVRYYCPDEQCQQCDIFEPNICYQCLSYSYLFNFQCVSECPDRFYPIQDFMVQNEDGYICKPCNNNCSTCQTTSTNCLSCKAFLYLQDNQCLSECENGYKIMGTKCEICSIISNCNKTNNQTCDCDKCDDGYDLCSNGIKCILPSDQILLPISSFDENESYAIIGESNHNYCSLRDSEQVLCMKNWWQEWEHFKIEIVSNNSIRIKNYDKYNQDHYCYPKSSASNYLYCDATSKDDSQIIYYELIDDTYGYFHLYVLDSSSNKLLCSDSYQSGILCDGSTDQWTKFQIKSQQPNC